MPDKGPGPLDGIIKTIKEFFAGLGKKGEPRQSNAAGERKFKLPDLAIRQTWLVRIFVLFIVTLIVFSPFIVAHLFQNGANMPNWYAPGFEFGLSQISTPASWWDMVGNLSQYLPWLIWIANVPLLLWQLRRERKLAKELSDYWIVLLATVVFWFVVVFTAQVGQIGSGIVAWFGGVAPVPWGAAELIPVAGGVCLLVAYWATLSGSFDLTPVAVMAVLVAVVAHAYDGGDANWSKLVMAIGLVIGLVEVIRRPVAGGGKKNGDRAAALSLVAGAGIIFFVLKSVIFDFITTQIELTQAPPELYIGLGKVLYANATVVAMILAAIVAWTLRWQAGTLLATLLAKLGPKGRDLERLMPHPNVRFYDSTLLAHFGLLAVWLFFGGL